MKTPIACSLGLHILLMLLVAFSPTFRQKMQPPEVIIPVNLVSLPSPPPPPPESPPVRTPPESRPMRAETPREKVKQPLRETPHARPPAEAPAPVAPRPRAQDLVIPDLASRMNLPEEPAVSLKEKVQTRLRKVEPPSSRPASVRKKPLAEPAPPGPPEDLLSRSVAQPSPAASHPPLPSLSTEGADFPYSWYVAVVQNAIFENWSPPRHLLLLKPGAGAYVRFRISRDGGISEITLKESSGSAILDRSAMAAVKGMGGLPPLPAEFPGRSLHVVVFFQPLSQ